jgi:hypothetical protein
MRKFTDFLFSKTLKMECDVSARCSIARVRRCQKAKKISTFTKVLEEDILEDEVASIWLGSYSLL